jgi:hypothetical protein
MLLEEGNLETIKNVILREAKDLARSIFLKSEVSSKQDFV